MNPNPDQQDQQDLTPPEAEQTGTTPPAAEPNAGTTPPDAEKPGTDQTLDVEKVVKKRLERERKKWEAEREEAEKRARMDEAERLKAELADRDKAIAERDAALAREKAIRSLSGKVADPEAAYKLAEGNDDLLSDGQVDADALLQAYPFLAPTPAGPNATRGAGGSSLSASKAKIASLEEQLGKARNRQERIALQRQIRELKKGE